MGKYPALSTIDPETMNNKEVQTDFPSGMLEEYVWENRRRVMKLLRYPQHSLSHGEGNKFEDMSFKATDFFVKPSKYRSCHNIVQSLQHKIFNSKPILCWLLQS